jgi:hypothetical protein
MRVRRLRLASRAPLQAKRRRARVARKSSVHDIKISARGRRGGRRASERAPRCARSVQAGSGRGGTGRSCLAPEKGVERPSGRAGRSVGARRGAQERGREEEQKDEEEEPPRRRCRPPHPN